MCTKFSSTARQDVFWPLTLTLDMDFSLIGDHEAFKQHLLRDLDDVRFFGV